MFLVERQLARPSLHTDYLPNVSLGFERYTKENKIKAMLFFSSPPNKG